MKWFKHYSNASGSVSLSHLIDELGVEGYGRYWLLLELLADEFDGENANFEVHLNKILAKLHVKFVKKLETFLQKLSDFRLIQFSVDGKVYRIEAPILLELQSRDFKKARIERAQTAPKNKIENKTKIKDKEEEEKLPPLAEIWNSNCHKLPKVKATNKTRNLKSKAMLDLHGENNLTAAIMQLSDSDFANGDNDRAWVADFDFFLQTGTYAKIIEGKYDNRKKLTAAKDLVKSVENLEWASRLSDVPALRGAK